MKALNLFSLFLLFCFNQLTAQVNLAAGHATQSFPLFNYADNRSGLQLAVGLTYNSGNGLQVGEIASSLGSGWNLEAGGTIMRVQAGQPDDQMEFAGDGSPTSLSKFAHGFIYSPYVGMGCNYGWTRYTVFKGPTAYKDHNVVLTDTEQDKFAFSFGGRTGIFIIGRDWRPRVLGDSRLKIEFTTQDMRAQGIRTTINQFVITTEDGIKYTFRDRTLSKICRYKLADLKPDGTFTIKSGDPDNNAYAVNRYWGTELEYNEIPFMVSGWNLSEIENTNNGEKIVYTYSDMYTDMITGKHVAHTRDMGSGVKGKIVKKGREQTNLLLQNPDYGKTLSAESELDRFGAQGISVMYIRSIQVSKRLDLIQFPNGTFLNFNYAAKQRADLPGEAALTGIRYFNSGGIIRGYEFQHGYFFKREIRGYDYPLTSAEKKYARLCLLSMRKTGTGLDAAYEPPYRFEYYTGSTNAYDDMVPARNTLSVDDYGFYNGSNSDLSIIEDHDYLGNDGRAYFKAVLPKFRSSKINYARNGLLKTIRYPTGGSLTYEYEQKKSGYRVPSWGIDYRIPGVSVSRTIYHDGEDASKNIITNYSYVLENGKSSHWGDEASAYYGFSTTDFFLKKPRKYKYPGVEYPEMATSIDWSRQIGNAILMAAVQTAGMIILYVIFGSVVANVAGIVVFVAGVIYALIVRNQQPEYASFSLSNQNYVMQNPLPHLYSRVEVATNSPTGYNGKTVHNFTDYKLYPILNKDYKWPWVPVQRAITWAYGLPMGIGVYDKNNNLVSGNTNLFIPQATPIADINNTSCKCVTHKRNSLKDDDWYNKHFTEFTRTSFDFMTTRFYYNYTGRSDQYYTIESRANQSGIISRTNTLVITDPATLLQKSSIVYTEADRAINNISYYPTDYNIPGPLATLKQRNAIHTPVATERWLKKSDENVSLLIDASITEYKEIIVNGVKVVKPWKVYTLNTRQPITSSVMGPHNPNVLIRKPEYFRVIKEFVYDNNAILVQTIADDNVESFITDFKNNYTTASVFNAAYNDIAYTSFEADNKGNWSYDQSFQTNSITVTGLRCFEMDTDANAATAITRTGLNANNRYIITAWLNKTGAEELKVNGQVAIQTEVRLGDWLLVKAEVSGVTQVTITGKGKIDELRLHPVGSLMTSTAYLDGIGPITVCDANNKLMFTEYDGLGRVKLERDQQRNVIKTYEYNFKK